MPWLDTLNQLVRFACSVSRENRFELGPLRLLFVIQSSVGAQPAHLDLGMLT